VAVAAALRGRRGRERYVVGEPEIAAVVQHAGVEAGRGIGGGDHARLAVGRARRSLGEQTSRAQPRAEGCARRSLVGEPPAREQGNDRCCSHHADRCTARRARRKEGGNARRFTRRDPRLVRTDFPRRVSLESSGRESRAALSAGQFTRTQCAPRDALEEKIRPCAGAVTRLEARVCNTHARDVTYTCRSALRLSRLAARASDQQKATEPHAM
jgi:hypothetical protein